MRSLGASAGVAAAFAALAVSCSSDDAPGNETYSREKLMDPETCAECHPKHHEEWSGSMHAYASEDPVFLAMNRRGQEETGGELGDFCVNCHAPLAVREGATTDGLNMESVPKELQGVTCYFCHQVNDIKEGHTGNNPLLLANDVTMRASITDPAPSRAHRSAYSPFLDNWDVEQRSSRMCGTCHDFVMAGHFSGAPADVLLEQTFAEWQKTSFSDRGPAGLSCGNCHAESSTFPEAVAEPPQPSPTMPVRDRHSHYFAAVDTALTDFPDTATQANLVRTSLDEALRAELCVITPGGAISLTLENLLAGHNFPSGASKNRRVWAELHVFDQAGKDAYQSGAVPMGEPVTRLRERGEVLFSWWDEATKADGSKAHMFWDVAAIDRDPARASIPGTQSVRFLEDPLMQGNSNLSPARTVGAGTTGVFNPSRVTATIWLEPVGIDIIEDLMESGHLRNDEVKRAMPRHALLPSRLKTGVTPDPPVTIAWDLDRIRDDDAYSANGAICFETAPRPGVNR